MVLAVITLPISGRQVAKMVKTGSTAGVSLVLERLNFQGVINVVEAGPSNLYSINRDHVAYPAIEALTDLRGKLYARMAAEVETWAIHPISVAIFGSAARGDGDVNSDIDILIVPREDLVWDSQLSEFSSSVRKWSGNRASLIQASPSQLIEMVGRKEPIVASLQMDARYIWGPNIMNSLMDQKLWQLNLVGVSNAESQKRRPALLMLRNYGWGQAGRCAHPTDFIERHRSIRSDQYF